MCDYSDFSPCFYPPKIRCRHWIPAFAGMTGWRQTFVTHPLSWTEGRRAGPFDYCLNQDFQDYKDEQDWSYPIGGRPRPRIKYGAGSNPLPEWEGIIEKPWAGESAPGLFRGAVGQKFLIPVPLSPIPSCFCLPGGRRRSGGWRRSDAEDACKSKVQSRHWTGQGSNVTGENCKTSFCYPERTEGSWLHK